MKELKNEGIKEWRNEIMKLENGLEDDYPFEY